jgi:hypothetical protein
MPGPTSRGTYIGKNKFAGLMAAAEKRAAVGFDHFPRCRVCSAPMVCGQETSNRGAHFVCAPPTT